jgi:hypothetical protein
MPTSVSRFYKLTYTPESGEWTFAEFQQMAKAMYDANPPENAVVTVIRDQSISLGWTDKSDEEQSQG